MDQDELELMAKLMAESIVEKDKKDNMYKFYLILVTILSLTFIIFILIIFFYLSDKKLASKMSKTNHYSVNQNNKICYDVKNENILKIRYRNNIKWVYKTYHTNDELVYITTAKR